MNPSSAPQDPAFADQPSADRLPPRLNETGPALDTEQLKVWIRRFIICNPFYLASAAVLLFGLSRLTQDTQWLTTETRQLLFQFGALQAYGCLVVATAVWLARKRIWYDSALLVVLENGLLLAPFLGVSQAVLIDETLAYSLAVSGGLAVLGRAVSLRRWYPEFHLPDPARLVGGLILAVNVGLPLVYRTRVDTDWYVGNQVLWLAILPALALLPMIQRRTQHWGGTAAQQSWLPLLVQGLWLTGTAVHAWSVAWIDKTPTPSGLLMPVTLASLWTLQGRHSDFSAQPLVGFRALLLVITGALPFWPSPTPTLGLSLAASNTFALVAYGIWACREQPLLRKFAWAAASLSLLACGTQCPTEWLTRWLGPEPQRWLAGGAVGLVFLTIALRSRHPFAGFLGALTVGSGAGMWATNEPVHMALQVGALFGLLHSVRWTGCSPLDLKAGRVVLGLVWTLDSLVLGWEPTRFAAWLPCAFGLAGALAFLGLRRWSGHEVPVALVGLAGGNLFLTPLIWVGRVTPDSVLTLAISLMLFAAGTILALRRRTPENGVPATPTPRSGAGS
jgi:hypothetical protein